MASNRSMFSKPSSGRFSFLSSSSPSRHELPRWRSPSPMTASMIPPPIVQSTYSSPPRQVTQSTVLIDKPTPLQDRQGELEADLQFLLDAQADGLVRGLEGGLADDQTSTGSTTPTATSVRSSSTRRAARPVRRKPGLRSARKGIYTSIRALSTVKDEELRGIDDQVQEQEQSLQQIDVWEKKKAGLQEASGRVHSEEETVRLQRLQQEADTLQEEINSVELQLSDMKARHRKLLRQAAAVENSVQARLASYTSSLRMLEEDVQQFLSRRPSEGGSVQAASSPNNKTSVWQLPPKRRTLEMAKQQWADERDAMMQLRQGVVHEKSALDEGATLWKDVVTQVTEFERKLRSETSKQQPPSASSNSGSAWEDPSPPQQDIPGDTLARLLQEMEDLTVTLDTKLEHARERRWNLLIAAIGAEVDALKRGRRMLESVIHPSVKENEDLVQTDDAPHGGEEDLGDEIRQLDKSFETARRRPSSSGTDSGDDPDPELLFSTREDEAG